MSIRKPLKIVFIGNASVGKTSILQSYIDKRFTGRYKATIGADLSSIETTFQGKPVILQIWDTAGQQKFNSLGGVFYRGADCCVIVYDITDKQSFNAIEEWKATFILEGGPKQPQKFPFVIIGNKSDLEQQRRVSVEEVEKLRSQNKNFVHLNVSAKEQSGLDILVDTIAKKAYQNHPVQIFIPQFVKIRKTQPKDRNNRKLNCCS